MKPLALLACLLLAGCQSSVRVTPGEITGTHEHTVTTIGPAPGALPPIHVRIQEEAAK